MGTFVGIDLGTTFSVVAHIDPDGHAIALPNHLGQTLTPSVVDLNTDPPTVGLEAAERREFGDEGIYAFFKRDMGNAEALYLHEGREYSPVDLSATVLHYLKTCAEDVLGQRVSDAVITVPAYFNNMQREATIEAGKLAGLNVLRIINEPTAAALAYGVRPSPDSDRVLVYDLGGGTFDVSLVEITPTELHVIATEGDHYLGGKDWDDVILRYLASQFERETGLQLMDDDISALRNQAEQMKISLSSRPETRINVGAAGQQGRYSLVREQFERMTVGLMERTQRLVEQVLKDASITWDDLRGVVLVGGSTRMPMVHEYVERMSGKPPMAGVHPDQAVALGAAIQAAMDMEDQGKTAPLLLAGRKASVDVISNSLGLIAESDDRTHYVNSVIIQKNQPIPCQQTRPYQLRVSRQREQNRLEVFMTQGEVTDPQEATYLGMYEFSNIPPVLGHIAVIDITYAYNINGMLEVSAVERESGQPLTLRKLPVPFDVPERFANPPPELTTVAREHLTVYLAIDVSGSMSGKPLKEAKKAAHQFLHEVDLTAASIGIIEWSNKEKTLLEASQNARQISAAIDAMRTGRTGYGTRGNPFAPIFEHLEHAPGLRYGLILTDGKLDRKRQAIETAEACRAAGIEIIAIGFGKADRKFLDQVSSSDQHSFFVDMNQLGDAFSTIAQELTEGGGQLDPERMRQRRGMKLL